MAKKLDRNIYIGKTYNSFTILSFGKDVKSNYFNKKNGITYSQLYRVVRVKCVCGKIKSVRLNNLISNKTKSCGCQPLKTKYSHIKNKSLMNTWYSIMDRCYNKKSISYKNYGGRGIGVCDRWLSSPENFISDMGNKPSPHHSIDRIDVNGNYEPSNCRWATSKEQLNNTRISGKLTQANLALKCGLSRERVRQIYNDGLIHKFVLEMCGKHPIFSSQAIQYLRHGKHRKNKRKHLLI